MPIRRLLAGPFVLFALLAGCSSAPIDPETDPPDDEDNLGVSQQAVCGTTTVDWSKFPAGDGTQQCVRGVIRFYAAKFGATVPAASGGPVGSCARFGACNYWVNPANRPSAAVWNRYAWGTKTPQAYDLVIFAPTSSNPYGHVASIDHMVGSMPYVMDSNYSPWAGRKAACVHDTANHTPYGFYRLKSLEPTATAPAPTTSCHDSQGGFSFSCDGPVKDQVCVNVTEPGDPSTWEDNYFCTRRDHGMKWSNSGTIPGMTCAHVGETAGGHADAWADDYLCLPQQAIYSLEFSNAGPIKDKNCVAWNETLAKSWDDNYVCTDTVTRYSAGGFTFSNEGAVKGQTCVDVTEPGTDWTDDHLCHPKDLGLKWSSQGAIDGMRCTNITQPGESYEDVWADDFLCLPKESEYTLTYSTTGPVAGKACVRWYDHVQGSQASLAHFLCVEGPDVDPAATGPAVTDPSATPGDAPDAPAAEPSSAGCSTGGATPAGSGAIAGGFLAVASVLAAARRRRRI